MEQLKKKLFELGVAAPYMFADALAGVFEETVDNLPVVKYSRANKVAEKTDEEFIDVDVVMTQN